MTAFPSAAAAYRADMQGRPNPYCSDDGAWLVVASVLQHAALATDPIRGNLIRNAIEIAHEVVADQTIERLRRVEWQGKDISDVDAIILIADSAHDHGAFNISSALLDAMLGAKPELSPLQRGRIIARRARTAWKLGALEESAYRYRTVEHLGRATKSAELHARAWIGLSAVATMKGNYPEVRLFANRALRMARQCRSSPLERLAHNSLMIACAASGDFDKALAHGWAVFTAVAGDMASEAEILQNIGQLLLESSHFVEARAAFRTVLSKELPARIILPALGGLAIASATLGDESTARWVGRELAKVHIPTAPRFAMASALLECARAFAELGDEAECNALREKAVALANQHRFHEIAYRAEILAISEPTAVLQRPAELNRHSAKIARQLSWMAPERLPDHVLIAAVRE